MTAPDGKDFSKLRFAFIERASGRGVPALALKLAYLIAFKYMNRDTAEAFPSQATLAVDLGCTDRTVRTMTDVLRPLGLLVETRHGWQNCSVYRVGEPETDFRIVEREPEASFLNGEQRTGNLAQENRKSGAERTGSQLPPNPLSRTIKRNHGGSARARASPPPVASDFKNGSGWSKRTAIADDWSPSEALNAFATSKGFDTAAIAELVASFVDHSRINNIRSADWDASWRRWVKH